MEESNGGRHWTYAFMVDRIDRSRGHIVLVGKVLDGGPIQVGGRFSRMQRVRAGAARSDGRIEWNVIRQMSVDLRVEAIQVYLTRLDSVPPGTGCGLVVAGGELQRIEGFNQSEWTILLEPFPDPTRVGAKES